MTFLLLLSLHSMSLIWPHSGRADDPVLCSRVFAEGLCRSVPTEVAREILGGDAVESSEPFLQAPLISVHMVDVIFRRLRLWTARRGHSVNLEPSASREGGDGRTAVAPEIRGRS